MEETFRRLFKRKLAMTGSLGAAALLLLAVYVLTIFLNETPEAVKLTDDFLEKLVLKGQTPIRMDLKVDVMEGPRLVAAAHLLMQVEPGRNVFYFLLNPDLDVLTIKWNNTNLDKIRTLGAFSRVVVPRELCREGTGTLSVIYSGSLPSPRFRSIFTPDLVYLDPDDGFYPRFSYEAVPVNVHATFP
jgi:hypothetical protein